MKRRQAGLAALLAALGAGAPARGAELSDVPAPGALTRRVECSRAPGKSYALYLPPAWSADRRWPVLYLLDARARGPEAAEPFLPAASRLGFVVASSNDSTSDGPLDPPMQALFAMLDDTRRRFSLDDARLFFGGFSGGARAAAYYADNARLPVAGLLLCGAGLLDGQDPKKWKPIPVFATIGEVDFNYYEVRGLGRALVARGVPVRVAVFEGGHRWPPEPVASEALDWLDRAASTRPGEPPEIDPTLIPSERRREERERKDLAARMALLGRLVQGDEPETAGSIARKLGVPGLKGQRESKERPERLFAERSLFSLWVQASFYLPAELEASGRPRKAALARAVAGEIGPPASPTPTPAP